MSLKVRLLQNYGAGLKPYETCRYEVSRDGVHVGFVSRYYYDHSPHWYIWNDAGVRAEVNSRKHGVETWEPYIPGKGFQDVR